MDIYKLESVAQTLVAKGKGILAADESLPTIKKRFDKINLVSTEETRRAYRELLSQSTQRLLLPPGLSSGSGHLAAQN